MIKILGEGDTLNFNKPDVSVIPTTALKNLLGTDNLESLTPAQECLVSSIIKVRQMLAALPDRETKARAMREIRALEVDGKIPLNAAAQVVRRIAREERAW